MYDSCILSDKYTCRKEEEKKYFHQMKNSFVVLSFHFEKKKKGL